FVPPEMRLAKLKQDAKESKVQPATLGLLALAQREKGMTREAEATLAELWSRVPFYEKPDWEKLFEQRSNVDAGQESRPAKSQASMATVPTADSVPTGILPRPDLGKVERAWGPIPGFAPRLEPPADGWLMLVESGDLVLVDSGTGTPRWRRPWKQPLFW